MKFNIRDRVECQIDSATVVGTIVDINNSDNGWIYEVLVHKSLTSFIRISYPEEELKKRR